MKEYCLGSIKLIESERLGNELILYEEYINERSEQNLACRRKRKRKYTLFKTVEISRIESFI